MKIILLFMLPVIALALWFNAANLSDQLVNPVIGDESFIAKFGHKPEPSTDNDLRVKTHLLYVENMLRHKDISHLSAGMQVRRAQMLDLLREYAEAGIFPVNYDYADKRKPCFIDKNNKICAVGYLIEQTAGRKTAEQINAEYKYEEIMAMRNPIVDNWIARSGLTKKECAMIQPTYRYPSVYVNNRIPAGYGITSSIVGGINLSLNTINGIQIAQGKDSKAIALTGMLTGAGQVVIGAVNFQAGETNVDGMKFTNDSKRTLSMVNIGLGSTTLLLSTWNLFCNKKPKDKRTTWNLHTFPDAENKTGLMVNVARRF